MLTRQLSYGGHVAVDDVVGRCSALHTGSLYTGIILDGLVGFETVHLVLISVGIPEKLCAHLGLNPGKEPCLRKFSIGMLYSGDAL